MGMHFDASNQESAQSMIENQRGPFTLGYNATSPLDLASAYSTIAASGTQCDPTPITAILDVAGKPATKDDGTPLFAGDSCHPNAIPAGVANTLANMMLHVVEDGTGRSAAVPGHDIAGKTGTIQGDNSATFVGITPQYAVSVMYYNPKRQQNVGGHGGGLPARVFHDAMTPILAGQPNTPFPPSDPAIAAGTRGTGYVAPAPDPTPPPSDGTTSGRGTPPADSGGQPGGGGDTGGNPGGGGDGGGDGGGTPGGGNPGGGGGNG
jgi:membrane peptidoglycan carboxypeptidase